MSSYQKFTLSTFKKKLANGDYENATGANRAIGKTQELSEGDKAKAKAMVATHFGVEPSKASPKKKASKSSKKAAKAVGGKVPAKKTKVKSAKKVAVKPAPTVKPAKKVAKRTKKKASKRKEAVAAPAAEPEPEAAPPPVARAKPLRTVAPRPVVLASTGTPADNSRLEKIQLMGQVITHVDVILRSMELSKKLFPKGDIERGVQSAQTIMTRAVSELEKAVTSDAKSADTSPPVPPPAKASPKKGKRAPKVVTAPDTVESAASEGEPAGGALDLNDPTLTDKEREEIKLARKVRPAVDKRFGTTTTATATA